MEYRLECEVNGPIFAVLCHNVVSFFVLDHLLHGLYLSIILIIRSDVNQFGIITQSGVFRWQHYITCLNCILINSVFNLADCRRYIG